MSGALEGSHERHARLHESEALVQSPGAPVVLRDAERHRYRQRVPDFAALDRTKQCAPESAVSVRRRDEHLIDFAGVTAVFVGPERDQTGVSDQGPVDLEAHRTAATWLWPEHIECPMDLRPGDRSNSWVLRVQGETHGDNGIVLAGSCCTPHRSQPPSLRTTSVHGSKMLLGAQSSNQN